MDEKMSKADKVRKFVSDHPALVLTTAYVGVFAVSYVGGRFLTKKYERWGDEVPAAGRRVHHQVRTSKLI